MLEPPVSPNHRAFFHSLLFGGITCYVGFQAWKDFQMRRHNTIASGSQLWGFTEYVDIGLVIVVDLFYFI